MLHLCRQVLGGEHREGFFVQLPEDAAEREATVARLREVARQARRGHGAEATPPPHFPLSPRRRKGS